MLAEQIDPTILAGLAADLGPVILVVGTNGKTTTARLAARIVGAVDGRPPIANRSGANLRQGLTSTLVAEASLRGGLRTPGRTAVFEVDELALPAVLEAVRPAALVIANLFRDQLDRYGEVDTVIDRWRTALARLPASTVIVACADDPRVDRLAADSGLPTIRFGLGPEPDGSSLAESLFDQAAPAVADPVDCPTCGRPLIFTWRSIGHLGDWACPVDHVRRAEPDLTVQLGDAADGPDRLRFRGAFGDELHRMSARLLGRRVATLAPPRSDRAGAAERRVRHPGPRPGRDSCPIDVGRRPGSRPGRPSRSSPAS